jgi:hypothetical protein
MSWFTGFVLLMGVIVVVVGISLYHRLKKDMKSINNNNYTTNLRSIRVTLFILGTAAILELAISFSFSFMGGDPVLLLIMGVGVLGLCVSRCIALARPAIWAFRAATIRREQEEA